MKHLYPIMIIVIFFSCSEEKIKPVETADLKTERLPVQESWDAEIYFTEEGKLSAVLDADHLMVFDDKNETELEGVKIDFYNEDEVATSFLTSKRGKVDNATNDMYAIDSVVAVNDSGVTLTTDELMWRNKDQKIVTDKFVTIISSEEEIRGYGFESDQNLENYVIYNITYTGNKSEN